VRHGADLIFGIAMLSGAVIAIVRPDIIIRWAKRAHSQLAEDDEIVLPGSSAWEGCVSWAFFWLIMIPSFEKKFKQPTTLPRPRLES
jgi:hypothetical protein